MRSFDWLLQERLFHISDACIARLSSSQVVYIAVSQHLCFVQLISKLRHNLFKKP